MYQYTNENTNNSIFDKFITAYQMRLFFNQKSNNILHFKLYFIKSNMYAILKNNIYHVYQLFSTEPLQIQ